MIVCNHWISYLLIPLFELGVWISELFLHFLGNQTEVKVRVITVLTFYCRFILLIDAQGLLFWMLYALLRLFQKVEDLQPSNSLSALACLLWVLIYLFIWKWSHGFSVFGEDNMYSFCVNNHVFMWIWLCSKMCEAVFQILRVGKSLELIMASFQLLNELDKVLNWSLYFNSIYIYILRCHIILTSATLGRTSF